MTLNAFLITSDKYYTNSSYSKSINLFTKNLNNALKKCKDYNITLKRACFRFFNDGFLDKAELDLLELFLSFCKDNNILASINLKNHNFIYASAFKSAVHLKANALQDISNHKYILEYGYSAHSLEDLKQGFKLGASYATISPIFYVPNKNKPLGKKIISSVNSSFLDKEIYFLGGINTKEALKQVKDNNAKRFASIGFFI